MDVERGSIEQTFDIDDAGADGDPAQVAEGSFPGGFHFLIDDLASSDALEKIGFGFHQTVGVDIDQVFGQQFREGLGVFSDLGPEAVVFNHIGGGLGGKG